MRRLFLQKVPHHSLLEVNLRPLEVDRANCPKEQDLIALVEVSWNISLLIRLLVVICNFKVRYFSFFVVLVSTSIRRL